MHGRILSCINRIEHENFSIVPRIKPTQAQNRLVDNCSMAGSRPTDPRQRDRHHHLPTHYHYILQCASSSRQHRDSHGYHQLSIILRCDDYLYGQRTDDGLHGHRNHHQDLESHRPMRSVSHLYTIYRGGRQYVTDSYLSSFQNYFL